MIRAQAPILWNSTASFPHGDGCGFGVLRSAQTSVEKQRAEVRHEY